MDPLARLAAKVTRLEGKVDKLTKDVNPILEGQQAFKTGGKLITWLAKVAAAAMLLYGVFKLVVMAAFSGGSKP